MPLTDAAMRNAIPGTKPNGRATTKPYKMSDASGLYLEVAPNGGKWWRFRFRFGGKQNTLSCGVFPDVSLDEARQRRDELRLLLADGVNPSAHIKAERAARIADEARAVAATRFTLDNEGALSFRLGSRCLALTPAETIELRFFLDATRAVGSKVTPCR